MTPDDYMKDRVEDQIAWYNAKSQSNQRWYKRLRIIELIFASLIPFLVGHIANDTPTLKVIVGLMGVCIAVISGVVALYKFQENWIEYRTESPRVSWRPVGLSQAAIAASVASCR